MRKLFSRGYKSGYGSDADHNYNIGSAVSQILALTSVQDSDIDFIMPDLTSAEIFKIAARLFKFDIEHSIDSEPN